MTERRRKIYTGRIVDLDLEAVTLPNGTELEMEIISHPGGAAVVALNDELQVCLLHQYRHIADGYLWELPAGKIDNEEPPLETARRELADEAGVLAAKWEGLGEILSSPGVFSEVIYLYLARQLKIVESSNDADEVLEAHWIPWDKAMTWAQNGKIRDAKSLVGLMRASATLA
ncbi:MAG: NUDIX hydrolase [Gammaproteobacteria bacterium]|nr:NUDIX hydrolase [Gammaproteobacteria bacterium]MDH3766944.1 NUDIX hydrolase [Gammaproteobacteria bacterium]